MSPPLLFKWKVDKYEVRNRTRPFLKAKLKESTRDELLTAEILAEKLVSPPAFLLGEKLSVSGELFDEEEEEITTNATTRFEGYKENSGAASSSF